MLHQGVRVRDIATDAEVEAGQRPRHDARPRDHAEGRGSGGAGRSARRRRPATPAEPEVIKKGKKDEDEDEKDDKKKDEQRQNRVAMKAIVGLGNPGREVRGHAAQHRVRGASTSWRGAAASAFESAPVDALIAEVARGRTIATSLLAKPLTFMNASGQAVGALARYFKIDAGGPAGRRRRSAAAARQAAGAGAADRPAGTTG